MSGGARIDRREFLVTAAVAGAGLVVGCRERRESKERAGSVAPAGAPDELNAWVHIGPDGTVTVHVSESEMGQGTMTAVAMLIADELGADWSKVRAVHALADDARYGRQSTGGSTSIRMGYDSFRKAGAAAREMLVAAAAARWGVAPEQCSARDGQIVHPSSGRSAGFGELALEAGQLDPPAAPRLKDRSEYRLVGSAVRRLDAPAKVTGEARFGIDVRVEGLAFAVVARPPRFGARLRAVDDAAARAVVGVLDVVQIPAGVAVVAQHTWAAIRGREALVPTWDDGPHADLSSARVRELLREACARGVEVRDDGDAVAELERAARRVQAVYEAPYLAHATMEPMNATAHVVGDRCEIWAGTQAQTSTRKRAAEILGVPVENVIVHTEYLGGGFGRRSQTDFIDDAVHLSKAAGRPVQVLYTREDDMRAGWFRPVAYNELAGAVGPDGLPTAWTHRVASASILERFGPLEGGIDQSAVEGAADLPYDIPNVLVTYGKPDLPVPTWWWRSVGHSQNAWAVEGFLDELIRAGGGDPLEVRRKLLGRHPRLKRVLEVAAERAGWGTPPPTGRARGLAAHASFGSFVAQVAEVSIAPNGTPRVHRVTCAIDCGQVVYPDQVVAQMESGIIYGLSAALHGEITFQGGRVVQGNFDDYPVVRMDEAPEIEVVVVPSEDKHGGVGEPGLPPIAAAVCNAILALTGNSVRKLPIGRPATT